MGLSERIDFCVRHPTDTITLYLQSNLHRRKISGFPHTLEWFTGNSTSEQFLVCQITVLLAELLHAAHQGRKGKFQPPHLGRCLKELSTMHQFKDAIVEISVIPCAMYLNQSFNYSPLPIVHLNRFSVPVDLSPPITSEDKMRLPWLRLFSKMAELQFAMHLLAKSRATAWSLQV